MLCITDAYGVMNVKQAQFASKYVNDGCLLDCFRLHSLPIGTVSQASTYFCAYNFVSCTLEIFLAPAFIVSRTRQTFEASGKLVLPEDIPTLLLAISMPKLGRWIFNQTLTSFNGLKSRSFDVLFQSIQHWWYIFYGCSSFSKQNSSRKIDFACVDSRTAQAHDKLFQYLKVRLRYLWRRPSC